MEQQIHHHHHSNYSEVGAMKAFFPRNFRHLHLRSGILSGSLRNLCNVIFLSTNKTILGMLRRLIRDSWHNNIIPYSHHYRCQRFYQQLVTQWLNSLGRISLQWSKLLKSNSQFPPLGFGAKWFARITSSNTK